MSRRKATVAATAVVTASAAAAAVFAAGLPEEDTGAQAAGTTPAATADVRRETLVDTEDHDGSLGYGDPVALATDLAGTVTWLPANGSTITRGRPLYRIDDDPVLLFYGALPAYRALRPGVEGADVKQFEKNLWALGYRGFTVDDEYTWATAEAVEDWQDDRGLAETGTVELGRVVYRTGAVRVASATATPGARVPDGAEILQLTGVRRLAVVTLEMDDQRLARKGAKVGLTPAGSTATTGRITDVATSVETADDPNEDDTTVLDLTITIDGKPTGPDESSVTVSFTASQREDVLTVPVTALLALAEGGYGVQVTDATGTRTVAVETGLFAGGRVEIRGDGLSEGTKVGVPS
ncbi:peptidoglycan-binding protein [Actinoplanes sp. NBRC 101535]|uniref:peptidoglycan-binding protein n=1 Tax=Actinoplanes sp. NBRC 101535 TaxID=3032196 RepID=UPI00249FFE3A|nr:peptidoglycan-binding protein [Actinoplanes sp. NBRC 101535]GLY01391.1 peptidoglycan-binding protein [Actinoplanes sp. NBRC 101535]